ncbi:MAG TPA: homoserine kinase [Burkholderiales bacterium]
MAVYTPVSEPEIVAWLKRYAVGTLVSLDPIARGIENTNYFVTTTQGRYVLTLFERLPAAELPFYLDLMAHLARHGIPCPAPIADLSDAYPSQLNGKPAVLVTRLSGASIETPDAAASAALGALLARMHLAGRSFTGYLDNPRGPRWWRMAARAVLPRLDAANAALLNEELRFQSLYRFPDLPRGPVHADLFRDNVLFEGATLSGVIDFYFAGIDCLLYDCAVCVNDWCLVDPAADRGLDPARTQAFLAAYAAVRPFTALERGAWPVLLRAAALRFWLSRLHDLHLPRPGMLVHAHDPGHFSDLLRRRVDAAPVWVG